MNENSNAVGAPVQRRVRPLLAPRDWQAMALREAAELTGTPEGSARLAESTRYAALADEIERLRRVWEDTRTQRDELLAHLTRKEPLPAWAVEWIKVYGA